MRWIKLTKEDKQRWHRWYAWYPVTVRTRADGSEDKIWFEWVERCGTYYHQWNSLYFEYRETP